jgi:hypothetical protein
MAPLFAGFFFGRGVTDSGAEHNPCGSELARDGFVSVDDCFVGVHIRCCGHGHLGFRPYGGSLWKSPKVTKGLLPLTFGASPRLGIPSLRSCSVGPPPSAIHGRRRLTRHPCRVAHCAEPALGLTRGRTPQKRPRRPTGRPVRGFRSAGRYLVGCQAVIASKLAPTGDWVHLYELGRLSGRLREQVGSPHRRSHRRAKAERRTPRSSPLIRPSVSSPAAFDLDPPAPSAG